MCIREESQASCKVPAQCIVSECAVGNFITADECCVSRLRDRATQGDTTAARVVRAEQVAISDLFYPEQRHYELLHSRSVTLYEATQ